MIIKKAIFAVDDNPKYSGLWPIVSETCFKKLGIVPVLFHITEEDSDFYEDEYGLVKKVKRIPDIDTGKQSQIIRMWGTRYFTEEVCIISDIDMMMFNREYFLDQVDVYSENDLVIYCSDAYDPNRSECVGIYGGNRYPICYNAASGNIFNKILGTDCDFNSYIHKVLSFGFPDFDSDEMYLGHVINETNHGVNIIKLKRGFYSKFKCPRRIDRVDDSVFNVYDESLLNSDYYVDCHLARPYETHKEEIVKLKKMILGEKKEVYLVGCHIENKTQLDLLTNLVNSLIECGRDYILSSHTMIPQYLVEKSVGFIYDKENPKYKIWDLPGKSKYEIDMGSFLIRSPYITYGRVDYYHVGPLRQLINGVNLIKTLNYDVVHWMDYDAHLDLVEERKNVERLSEYDFVFYGVGPKFSFNVDKFNNALLDMKSDSLLRLLSENEYVVEKVFSEHIIKGKKLFIEVNDPLFWGDYSQNFNEIKFDWSLFELGGTPKIFIKNDDHRDIIFSVKHSGEESTIQIKSNHWLWQPIPKCDSLGELSIAWRFEESNMANILVELNLADNTNYNNIVKSVDYLVK